MGSTKTDNGSLDKKLALRRRVLEQLDGAPLRVLDLFAGTGQIWSRLRGEYPVASYVGVDRQRRQPGLVIGDAYRLIHSFDLSRFNVVDVDCYGDPWEIFEVLSYRVAGTTAVFLTNGRAMQCRSSDSALRQAGIPPQWEVPHGDALSEFVGELVLAQGCSRQGVSQVWKAANGRTRYWGLFFQGRKH